MSDDSRERAAVKEWHKVAAIEILIECARRPGEIVPSLTVAEIIARHEAEAGPKGEATTQWTSVEERLPTPGYGHLLVVDGRVQYGFLRSEPGKKASKWSAIGRVIHGHVTHWMSLPAPPASTKRESGSAK